MAVASDDLPRFSLLCGAGAAFARPQTPQIEAELLAGLRDDFTCECWVQIRVQRGEHTADGCWLLHTPSWACGLTSDLHVIVYCCGMWMTTASTATRKLQARRWHHLAVSYRSSTRLCMVIIDGEIADTEELSASGRVQLPLSPTAGVRIGWSPLGSVASQLVLHEFRVWCTAIADNTIQTWKGKAITNDHPSNANLVAHWSFSSGSTLSLEWDLSGFDRDLVLEGFTPPCWLRVTPHIFVPPTEEIARIITMQDTGASHNEHDNFVVEVEVHPPPSDLVSPLPILRNVTIVLALNFLCCRGQNLTLPGKGDGILKRLVEFVHQLPAHFRLATCYTSRKKMNLEHALMTEAGKNRICKVLERLIIESVQQPSKFLDAVIETVDQLGIDASTIDDRTSRRATVVMIVSDSTFISHEEEESMIDRIEMLQTGLRTLELHHIHASSTRFTEVPNETPRISRLVKQYEACGQDLEWILACILDRYRQIILSSAQLKLDLVGEGEFSISSGTNPSLYRAGGASFHTHSVQFGCGSYRERVYLVGSARFGCSGQSHIEIVFSYYTNDGRKHVARGQLSSPQDLTAHTHIERFLRNKQLRISDDQAQLLEQRRMLMQKKKAFISEFVSQEIAEAENSFKKINVMKEELWARKKWIVSRAFRLFNEAEVQQLESEARTARSAFLNRVESLQLYFATSVGEAGSRGASRGGNNRRVAERVVRVDDSALVSADDHDSERNEEQQLRKVNVKLNLLVKAFSEHETKIEDLFASMRAAESKGLIIMNDVRRAWVVRYCDMMKIKKEILQLTVEKERLESKARAHEEQFRAHQELGTEVQFINSAIAAVEREHGKRRKKVAASVKEIFGCVVDEFESSQQLETANRDLLKAKLLRTVAVTHQMYASCIYLCFPLEISEEEVYAQNDLRASVNVVHAMNVVLRNVCDSKSQFPICRRLSHGECFLWWGLEQLTQRERIRIINEQRQMVRCKSWAVVLVTYNSLFSSAHAWSDLKETLLSAQDTNKSVFHIQLEPAHAGLENFRSHWAGRRLGVSPVECPPVEREYLTWKQNHSAFRALIRSVNIVEEILFVHWPLGDCCKHESVSLDPCLKCTWPIVVSTHQASSASDHTQASSNHIEFMHLARRIGAWIDGATSELLQSAPRSYHIDPNILTPLSIECEKAIHDRISQLDIKSEDFSIRRTREIQRQLVKVFQVYDDEAMDLVALRFKLRSRKEEVQASMAEKQRTMADEMNLTRTWLQRLSSDESETDFSRQSRDCDAMLSEELWDQICRAEAAAQSLEQLEEQEDSKEDEIHMAQEVLRAALNRSSRAILTLSRFHISDTLRSMTKRFKQDQYAMQLMIAKERWEEYQAQITRMNKVFDDGEKMVRGMQEQHEITIFEECRSFFNSSYLEICLMVSSTTSDFDHKQLRKLAKDLDGHSAIVAQAELRALHSQLALSAAIEYRVKLQSVIASFVRVYSPRVGPSSEGIIDEETVQLNKNLKDFCQHHPDDPASAWTSLVAMHNYMHKTIELDRESQRLREHWRTKFARTLLELHFGRWWEVAGSHLEHIRDRLHETQSCITDSYERHWAHDCELQAAVSDRESFARQMVLHQRQLLETKQRQHLMLQKVRSVRHSYEAATAVMNELLSNVKTDVSYKTWSTISEYHVGLIGELFDSRSECSGRLEMLETEIKKSQEKLNASDNIVATKHQVWLSESINDILVCTTFDALQSLAHRTLELVLTLERQRVFQQLRGFDPRGFWLTDTTLASWHGAKQTELQREEAARSAKATQRPLGPDGVDDLLIQLSIARLDAIKQEKWRDTLRRKLVVFEGILSQQSELRQAVESEVQSYRQIGGRLSKRVQFLRERYKYCSESDFLQSSKAHGQNQASSIDRNSAAMAIQASLVQLQELITTAQEDFLVTEAKTCQLAWRIQEHVACEYRARQAITEIKSLLGRVDDYLHVLKTKDRELFGLGLATDPVSVCVSKSKTDPMGMNLEIGRAVLEYYSRDHWFRSCLSQTTALGEKIKSLREIWPRILSPQAKGINGGGVMNVQTKLAGKDEVSEDDGEQLEIRKHELQLAELALLLNRFESRQAEKTSEGLKETLSDYMRTEDQKRDAAFFGGGHMREIDSILSDKTLRQRMFNNKICVTERQRTQILLRELATTFNPRDTAGNLSEVIFGASLDRNDLNGIFLLQSRDHLDQQWGVALVVLFFARLFRRASLKKAARLRRSQGSALTQKKLLEIEDNRQLADAVFARGGFYSRKPALENIKCLRARYFLDLVHLMAEEDQTCASVRRVVLGVLLGTPLHRSLELLIPSRAKPILQLADDIEECTAVAERHPPRPTKLRIVTKDRFSIKIEWKVITTDRDLVYVAEICEHSTQVDHPKRRYWTQLLAPERTNYTFHNLRPGLSYWVRVRAGFSPSRLGEPCFPLLIDSLGAEES